MASHLGLALIRVMELALDEGKIDQAWLERRAQLEGSRSAAGVTGSGSLGGQVRGLSELLARWFNDGQWRTDLEALGYEFRAGNAAVAVLRRRSANEELPEELADLVADDGRECVSLLDGLALIARLAGSEVQRSRWIERFFDRLPVLDLDFEASRGAADGRSPGGS